jgi:hypothetical protein
VRSHSIRRTLIRRDELAFGGQRKGNVKAVVNTAVKCNGVAITSSSNASVETVGKLRFLVPNCGLRIFLRQPALASHFPANVTHSAQNKSGTTNRTCPAKDALQQSKGILCVLFVRRRKEPLNGNACINYERSHRSLSARCISSAGSNLRFEPERRDRKRCASRKNC